MNLEHKDESGFEPGPGRTKISGLYHYSSALHYSNSFSLFKYYCDRYFVGPYLGQKLGSLKQSFPGLPPRAGPAKVK